MAAVRKPKQSPRKEETPLAAVINARLIKLGMTQKELAKASGINHIRINRLINGGKISIEPPEITRIAMALHMSLAERDKMYYLEWPDLEDSETAVKNGWDIFQLNIMRYEAGKPLFGNDFEE